MTRVNYDMHTETLTSIVRETPTFTESQAELVDRYENFFKNDGNDDECSMMSTENALFSSSNGCYGCTTLI